MSELDAVNGVSDASAVGEIWQCHPSYEIGTERFPGGLVEMVLLLGQDNLRDLHQFIKRKVRKVEMVCHTRAHARVKAE